MTRIITSKLALFASLASMGCATQQTGPIRVFNTVEIDSCCADDCCDDGCDDTAAPAEPSEPDPEPATDECPCPDGYEATPDGDACVMATELAATFSGVEYSVCQGDTQYVYGMYGAYLPGGTSIENDFWGQDNGLSDGRLNEIGVWACDSDGTSASTEPTGEWIGFTACLELEEAGTYLVGIAGDNRVRFSVDGTMVFELDSSDTYNFKRWHVIPIELTSGSHNIELTGRNNESIAAFGAEIYGPFPVGAVDTDSQIAALEIGLDDIVWTTGDELGQVFELGEESGWICPDGTSFDTCSAEPTCVERLEEECLVTE